MHLDGCWIIEKFLLILFKNCKGAGFGCDIGGYCIGKGYLDAKEFSGYGPGLEAIMRIMDTVGVERWEDLKGKYIRIKDEGWGSTIKCIVN